MWLRDSDHTFFVYLCLRVQCQKLECHCKLGSDSVITINEELHECLGDHIICHGHIFMIPLSLRIPDFHKEVKDIITFVFLWLAIPLFDLFICKLKKRLMLLNGTTPK